MKKHIKALNDFKQKINNLITDLNTESIENKKLSIYLQKNYLQYASDSLQHAISWLIQYENLENK